MEEKPIVVIFTSFYDPVWGGAEIAISQIVSRLAGDFEFHIITHRLSLDLPKEEILSSASGEVSIHRLGFGTALDRMFLFPFLAAAQGYSLIKKFEGRKILMWGVMVSYASIGAFLIKFFKKETQFLLTIQEGDNEWEKHSLMWRVVLKKVDYATAISNFLASMAREKGYGGLIEIVPNGVDEKLLGIERTTMPGGKIIFSASRLVKKNGLDILLLAAEKLKEEFEFKIMIAGDGEEKKNLLELRDTLGLKERVDFLGALPYEKLQSFYARSNIFARPSRSEGLGSAFLEAMASGLLTVGTDVGGIPDFLWEGRTGFLATPENVESFASALRTALTLAPQKSEIIIGTARNLIKQNYLWGNISSRMKNIFNKLLTA